MRLTWEDSSGESQNVNSVPLLLLLRLTEVPSVGAGQIVTDVNSGHNLGEVHLHHLNTDRSMSSYWPYITSYRHLLGEMVEELDLV